MKEKLFYPLLIGLVLLIATSLLTYVSQAGPNLRYSLSQPIPVSFLNSTGNPENVQQLEVRNVGNALSERIRIRVDGPVGNYQLDSFSKDDKPSVFSSDGVFEVNYPELPSQAGFKLTLKTQGFELGAQNLHVSDRHGVAQSALTSNRDSLIWIWVFLVWVFLYLPVMVFWVISGAINLKDSSLRYKSLSQINLAKRPWYVTKLRWGKICKGALESMITRDYMSDSQQAEVYALLRTKHLPQLSDGEKEDVLRKATDRFKSLWLSRLATCFSQEEVLVLLGMERPVAFPENEWIAMTDKAQEAYERLASRALYDVDKATRLLLGVKPTEIRDEVWISVKKAVQKRLIEELRQEIRDAMRPMAFVQEQNISVLDENSRMKLMTFAFEREFRGHYGLTTADEAERFLAMSQPEDLDEKLYAEFKLRAEKIIELTPPEEQT